MYSISDCNNLYGYAMCKKLPQKDFIWLTEMELTNLDILNYNESSDIGYVLEVILYYYYKVIIITRLTISQGSQYYKVDNITCMVTIT